MQFYVLNPESINLFDPKWAYADLLEPILRGKPLADCPICHNPLDSLEWLPPHHIKLSTAQSRKWGDIVWGAGFPFLVSEYFKAFYEQENLSGIESFSTPVEVLLAGNVKVEKLSYAPPPYHLVKIRWNGANLDDNQSNIIREKKECTYCRSGILKSLEGIVVELNSWDGSDIFILRGLSGVYIASEKFKSFLEKYKIKNVKLIPSNQWVYNFNLKRGWSVKSND